MVAVAPDCAQLPLIHCIESDDLHLEAQHGLAWFRVVRDLEWRLFREVAARYYEALWAFNHAQRQAREERALEQGEPNPETKDEARRRLLFSRAVLDASASVLHSAEQERGALRHVDAARLGPGQVPYRLRGRAPKCFFAMFKAFVGVGLMGRRAEPEYVRQELVNNPSFARTCGFTLPSGEAGYRQSDIPGLRKLEQFDQIMEASGLWDAAALTRVRANIEAGYVELEATGVHDTTHFVAYSAWQVVEAVRVGAQGKETKTRRSQSRATKRCRCADRDHCPHEWELADDGAGTIVKHRGKMVWGHKASTFSFAGQEVLLDAVAMTDAASHDSKSLEPHLERLFKRFPDLKGKLTRVLDDSALDSAAIKGNLDEKYDIDLCTRPNPRGRKLIREDLPRGIDHITKSGVPVCAEGFPFDFLGCRHTEARFLFRAPDDGEDRAVCMTCPQADGCLRAGGERRHITMPFARLPLIDPERPHLSWRFQKLMDKRTVIERLHKLMKFDYGDERLTKRGTAAFQARLDKTLLAMHLVIASP